MAKYLDPKADVTLTEIGETTREAPQDLVDNPYVNEALEIVEESALSDAERASYDGFWDRVSREATKEAEMRRAIAERDAAVARADAVLEMLHQAARNLKSMKLTDDQIAAATGLTVAEIAAI